MPVARRGTSPKVTPAATPGASPGSAIRIRMYRIGFGDCFLLSLPVAGGTEHILIDCGVHGQGDIHKIGDAVENVRAVTEGQLALVIASHAHQDHISGFTSFGDTFRQMVVREVWMPWTENPTDPKARQHKLTLTAMTEKVAQHLNAAPNASAKALYAVQNLVPNRPALDLLRSGINGGAVRYLEAGKTIDDALGIAGLRVRVLGPPRDEKLLGRMDPPSSDRFLRASADGVEMVGAIRPFDDRWTASAAEYPPDIIKPAELQELTNLAGDAGELALALDRVMNNTSLVVLFSYRGRDLLFPGDAQYGNWQGWINNEDAAAILGSLDFYKVAHHGSHNATPKSAFDQMNPHGFAAMISTQSMPWPSIPFEKLVRGLERISKGFVRSDTLAVAGAETVPAPPLPDGFVKGDFWYDYLIPVRCHAAQ
jgi:hypothetical protein